jgi:hypothetical protein
MCYRTYCYCIVCALVNLVGVIEAWRVPPYGQITNDQEVFDRMLTKKLEVHVPTATTNETKTFLFGTPPSVLQVEVCEPLQLNQIECEEFMTSAFRFWTTADYFPTFANHPLTPVEYDSCVAEASCDISGVRQDAWVQDYLATRGTILSYLEGRYQYKRYLELGTDLDVIFKAAREIFPVAVGVDPFRGGTHRMTSDEYFRQLRTNYTRDRKTNPAAEPTLFDLVFIDGLHEANQVYRDVMHAMRHLAVGGTIVMHDCNPVGNLTLKTAVPRPAEAFYWNGDTWKAAVALRMMPDIEIIVVDVDQGTPIKYFLYP